MRLIRFLLVLLVIAAVAAFFTRPGPEAFEARLDRLIRDRVAATDLEAGGDALPTLALAACKLRPTDCVAIVRGALDVRIDEGLFMTRVSVKGLGRRMTCRGAFTRFVCRSAE